jgi:hypothetical protein
VALALYDLLKGVNRRHAALMFILIVVSIPIAFVNELNSFAALVLVRGADFLFARWLQKKVVIMDSSGNQFLLRGGYGPDRLWFQVTTAGSIQGTILV